MGNSIWAHVSYAAELVPNELYACAINHSELNFTPTVFRYDICASSVALFECSGFNESNEPVIGRSLLVKANGDARLTEQPENPLVYHHKWLFVKDDYQGFDVSRSKSRSLQWKQILGVSRYHSSRIGRQGYWQAWLLDNNLPI